MNKVYELEIEFNDNINEDELKKHIEQFPYEHKIEGRIVSILIPLSPEDDDGDLHVLVSVITENGNYAKVLFCDEVE